MSATGHPLAESDSIQQASRGPEIEQARLPVLRADWMIDNHGIREIAAIAQRT